MLVLNIVQEGGLYSAGSGSPSENWGKLVHKKFYISLHCSCKFLNCAAIYTHSTTIIAKICTPDSAIYSLWSQHQVCMPYIWPHVVPLICLRTVVYYICIFVYMCLCVYIYICVMYFVCLKILQFNATATHCVWSEVKFSLSRFQWRQKHLRGKAGTETSIPQGQTVMWTNQVMEFQTPITNCSTYTRGM